MNTKILILDFGSQTTHLIKRRFLDLGIEAKIIDGVKKIAEIKKLQPQALVLSGGPSSVYNPKSPKSDPEIFKLKIPVLAICYGLQIVAHSLGGKVEKGTRGEYGKSFLEIISPSPLFSHLPKKFTVWMSHFDTIQKIPTDFKHVAETPNLKFAAFENRNFFCVQFHPEVFHTQFGTKILANFATKICKFKIKPKLSSWAKSITRDKIAEIKTIIGNNKAILALSGGVDSSVTAALCSVAIGQNLTCLLVDTGLMRQNEAEEIKAIFSPYPFKLKIIKAQKIFLKNLQDVTDPEKKRKIIGKTFIKVFEKEAKKIKNIQFLIQGTIYPDVIESQGTAHSAKIKSHHNVAGLPKKLNFKIVEPLRELYKDEVRVLGKSLGLPDKIIYRQVFPGPGLAIRIVGNITNAKLKILRQADKIVEQEIRQANLYDKLWMSFAILTGVKTVGVVGDERIHGETIALRALVSKDTMTADWAKLPYSVLEKISTRITNEVKAVCRVVYDITAKPPGTMEWE